MDLIAHWSHAPPREIHDVPPVYPRAVCFGGPLHEKIVNLQNMMNLPPEYPEITHLVNIFGNNVPTLVWKKIKTQDQLIPLVASTKYRVAFGL